jgi:acyl carrier protein
VTDKKRRNISLTIDEIKTLICVQLGLKKVRGTDHIVEDLGAESADVVNIIAAVEDKYGIIIEEEEVLRTQTVDDLSVLVSSKLQSTKIMH